LCWPRGAANVDEQEFPASDTFDITRRATRHLAFGFGPRYCLGAAMARLEAQMAFVALLDRLGSSKLAARPPRFPSPCVCAYQSVEIAV
jgi:cytochrome P450